MLHRLYRGLSSLLYTPPIDPLKVMASKDFAEAAIAGSTITIFSKSWCPYCTRAKNLLKSEFPETKTDIIELDARDDGNEIQDYLLTKTGQRSVPNIFINHQHVGGCDKVVELNSQGKLAALVNATAARL
ncbi:glutaredoxin [Cytidiella melzeri]|nr:glutaredoxin [Cytidiella melzeri]